MKLALFGGVYNNSIALQAAIDDAIRRGADRMICLGDLGAFGPHPNQVFPLLHDYSIDCLQGNYDDSIGHALNDCQCGYTDPQDNHFAQISYDYTLANTSRENRAYLRTLPQQVRLEIAGKRVLCCHGSPRRVNEFLWESTTSEAFLEWMFEENEADVILATHTGLHWQHQLSDGRLFVNVGVLGRPANDGTQNVWYTMLSETAESEDLMVEFHPVHYDVERVCAMMRAEQLPEQFIETLQTGWWTTCLEVLPSRERLNGRW